MEEKKNPIQPIITDQHGVIRFQRNNIVTFLLDHGPFDMNDIALKSFSANDREQFAQLIGYSLSGAPELSYFSEETLDAAELMYREGVSESESLQ